MKNLELKKCFSCSATSGRKLLLCGRCRGAQYCDAVCQRNNFKDHKKECKHIGRLLDAIEKNHLSNELVKKFFTQEEFGFDIWNEMKDTIEDLPNSLVRLVRSLQPLEGAYLTMGINNMAAGPVEEALRWQMKALKVVAYHTDHMAGKEGENKSDRLYFGGDWTNRIGEEDVDSGGKKTVCSNQMSCEYFAQLNAEIENRPDGQADPFFCFGGEQNIPEMLVLLGRRQEAVDYIAHWTKQDFWKRPHVPGAIVARFEEWSTKNYPSVDISKAMVGNPSIRDWDIFMGGSDSKVLLRIYGVLVLIRLHVITNIPEMKKKRMEQFRSFLLGTHPRLGENSPVLSLALGAENPPMKTILKHLCNNPVESKKRNYRELYHLIYATIHCTDNGLFYMTGEPRFQSMFSMMGNSCRSNQHSEVDRLVWDLFRMISREEKEVMLGMHKKINDEYRIGENFTDNELMN